MMNNGKCPCHSCWLVLTANRSMICTDCIREGRGPTPQPGAKPTKEPPKRKRRKAQIPSGYGFGEQMPAAVRFGKGISQ